MKGHILAALEEMLDHWEGLLASLNDEQITAPNLPSNWSIKDVIVHLWAWQQRSVARFNAALLGREPEFPLWASGLNPEAEADTDAVNAWIYAAYREKPWPAVHQDWRAGFRRLLELAEQVSERDLLDSGRYPWLKGHPLALILLATYDHHQEHFEKLQAQLREQGG